VAVPAGSGPTVRRILLGSQLRRLRERRGISRDDAGYSIRASGSKISRLELGRVSFKNRDVEDLLTLYGVVDPAERAAMLARVEDANKQGWWQPYAEILPSWFQRYIDLEESASLIRGYEVQFVPGLLQTEEYARAVISRRQGISKDVVDGRVHVRMTRQKVLGRSDSARLWMVLDEAAVRRRIGGRRVARAQIARLLELTDHPALTLQVTPFSAGSHAADGGAFTILRFPDPDLADLVYIERLTSASYLDKREEVDEYFMAMDQLGLDSATPDNTIELLRGIAQDL
jgi:transcriptional regulator with XRE-family HTH domain